MFVLADDLGWMDTSVYGSRYYETPNLDCLARRGMVFQRAYAASPLCTPTRASIMSGQHPARLQITSAEGHLPPLPASASLLPATGPAYEPMLLPITRRHLPFETVTLAEALRAGGYGTGFVGKWHLGLEQAVGPLAQGFDIVVAGSGDAATKSFFSPYGLGNLSDGPSGEYLTDRLTREAIAVLDQLTLEPRPFFLCLWHYAVHTPIAGKPELVDEYEGRVDPRGAQDNATMAAMIRSLDDSVGRLLGELERRGLAERTLVVFTSDNGGNEYASIGGRFPTNNDPLRGGKATLFEGGLRVPLIVSWPGVVSPGSRSEAVVSSVDLYPTFLEATGAPKPEEVIFDGVSWMPIFAGGSIAREAIFSHFPHAPEPGATGRLTEPGTMVVRGDSKLIRFFRTSAAFPNVHELYDLKADPSETRNLALERAALVNELDRLIDGFLSETQAVVPVPNPRYDPRALREWSSWRPSNDCTLRSGTGVLEIEVLGPDPYLATSSIPEGASGTLVVEVELRSTAAGAGEVFFRGASLPAFASTHRVPLGVTHDGQWHTARATFSIDESLAGLRIDPATGPGVIELRQVRLATEEGATLAKWEAH